MSNYDPNNPPPANPPTPPSYGDVPPPPPPAYNNPGGGGFTGGMPAAPQYGQMPGYSGGGYTPGPPPARPKSLDLAVKLMQAGGLLSLLNILSVFLFKDQIREAAQDSLDRNPTPDVDLDTVVNISIGFAVVFGLLGTLLWFWMASANGKGKSWARIFGSVLFGISLLSAAFSFTQPQPGLARILGLIGLAIGAGATYFMWQKDSTAYYNAMSAPRI